MADVVVMSPEFAKQVAEAVKLLRKTHGLKTIDTDYSDTRRITPSRFPDRCVILDAALAAASNSKTSPTSCLATICTWSTDDSEYVETDPAQQITVWNHSESTDHAADTFGVARNIDGHYWFFGDCDAMSSRGGA